MQSFGFTGFSNKEGAAKFVGRNEAVAKPTARAAFCQESGFGRVNLIIGSQTQQGMSPISSNE